jgi:hypothetical protein
MLKGPDFEKGMMAFMAILVAPVTEECFFRGSNRRMFLPRFHLQHTETLERTHSGHTGIRLAVCCCPRFSDANDAADHFWYSAVLCLRKIAFPLVTHRDSHRFQRVQLSADSYSA